MKYMVIPNGCCGECTIVFGEVIVYGGRAFYDYELEAMSILYNMPQTHVHALNIAYSELGAKYECTAKQLIEHNAYEVRRAFAIYGESESRELLIYDSDYRVRTQVAKHGSNRQRKLLLRDECWVVRYTAAKYGSSSIRRRLSNDVDWPVRYEALNQFVKRRLVLR